MILLALACAHPVEPAPAAEVSHIAAPEGAMAGLQAPERDRMLAVIRSGDPAVSACYTEALARNPALYGELVVRVELGPEGRVRSAVPEFSTLGDAPFSECVLASVAGLQFPAPSRDGLTLRYPYVFTAPSTPPEVTRALLLRHGLIPAEDAGLPTEDLPEDADLPPPPGVIVTW